MTILSDHKRTLLPVHVNPWQRLAEDWPRVQVVYADLGSLHIHGKTRWKQGQPVGILLHEKLTQVQRRCILAHELEHLDHGAPCDGLRAKIERRVIARTAKYLIPDLDALADVLAAYDLRRAADELWVTWPVLVDRLRAMTDQELEYVTQRRGEAVA